MTTTDNFPMNQLFDLDAGKPHVRFDERGVETGLRLLRHASTLLISTKYKLSGSYCP